VTDLFRVVFGVSEIVLAYRGMLEAGASWDRPWPGLPAMTVWHSVTLGKHLMQQEAGPGEVFDRAVLGLAAQPLLKSVEYAVVLCRAETTDEAAHE
jgi:hypothetical protein